jgi:transposase
MLYAGVDLGKRSSFITVVDESGQVIRAGKVASEPEPLLAMLDHEGHELSVAIEASRDWYWVCDLLQEAGMDVSLVHPLKAKAIASARIKSDRLDAGILAHLLRSDLIPCAYIADKKTRERRELLRYRAYLVAIRTSVKNRIHALLGKLRIRAPVNNIFTVSGRAWLDSLELATPYDGILSSSLRALTLLGEEIDLVTAEIRAEAEEDDLAVLLTTVPGVGYYTALLILSEIGDVDRFPTARHLCSYSGLVPSTYSSGNTLRHGKITRQGSRWLRLALVEVAIHAVQRPGRLRDFYEGLRTSKGVQLARTAAARKLLKTIYWMLKTGRAYDETINYNTVRRASSG